MSTVTSEVSKILKKKMVQMILRYFCNQIYFLSNIDKNWNENNKHTFRCYRNSESGPVSGTDKYLVISQELLISKYLTSNLLPKITIRTFYNMFG